MNTTMQEVLQFVRENDVKFIRLAFCDIFGTMKNIAILADELPRAFETGISFDASAVRGFLNVKQSDLLLFPDPASLAVLPWRPQQGRVVRCFCDIHHPAAGNTEGPAAGAPFAGDGRYLLKRAVERAAAAGYVCQVGAECEFYLFETDDQGRPTATPHDQGGYLDVAPADRGENVRREICLTLEEMGLRPESSHHEQGPGQNEIDFRYSDALTAADQLVSFKAAVRAVAARNGLFASFMPKPIEAAPGSGLHVNLSLFRSGLNIFRTGPEEHSSEAESFIAGILAHAAEMTALLNPLTNSYARFGRFEAPRYITWSHQNRSQLVRIPAGRGEYARMELRSPDPACNPYIAFALLLEAGLDGIARRLPLCPPDNRDLFTEADGALPALPASLAEAVVLAQESAFLRRVLPEDTLRTFLDAKREEAAACEAAPDRTSFERERYFAAI